jgi:hypothetical protein
LMARVYKLARGVAEICRFRQKILIKWCNFIATFWRLKPRVDSQCSEVISSFEHLSWWLKRRMEPFMAWPWNRLHVDGDVDIMFSPIRERNPRLRNREQVIKLLKATMKSNGDTKGDENGWNIRENNSQKKDGHRIWNARPGQKFDTTEKHNVRNYRKNEKMRFLIWSWNWHHMRREDHLGHLVWQRQCRCKGDESMRGRPVACAPCAKVAGKWRTRLSNRVMAQSWEAWISAES